MSGKRNAFGRSGLSPTARLQPRNSAILKHQEAVHTKKPKPIVSMKPSRLYPWRLRAAIAVIGTGVLALFASINANAQSIQWLDKDVGTPALAGSAVSTGAGSWTITGGGSDIWNASDN